MSQDTLQTTVNLDDDANHDDLEAQEIMGETTPPADTATDSGETLAWKKIEVHRDGKVILDRIEGKVSPRQLTGIMGHSGSGKTSLLKVLAGKKKFEGTVTLNDKQIDPTTISSQRKIAYVAQEDTLLGTSTCFEAIWFSARLRASPCLANSEITKLARRIVKDLALDNCADTQCKDLSGGQRRRVSVGIELVVEPSVVLLDEPLSGLDSHSAVQVMEVLKRISENGDTTVMLTIHQPSIQMWEMIDNVILLHEGRKMYNGSRIGVLSYFEQKGFPLPSPKVNPAEWMLTVSQEHGYENSNLFRSIQLARKASNDQCELWPSTMTTPSTKRGKRSANKSQKQQQKRREDNDKMADDKSDQSNETECFRSCHGRLSTVRETALLLKREMRHIKRDFGAMTTRIAMVFLGGGLLAIIFSGVARRAFEGSASQVTFASHVGALFTCLICNIMAAQVIMLDFVDGRPLFIREYSTDHFRLNSYMLSKMVMEGFAIFIQVLLVLLITYFAIGFQGRFWYMLTFYFAFGTVSTAFAIFLGSVVKNPKSARELSPLLFLPQTLLCGFYVAVSELPRWIRWSTFIMPLTYLWRIALEEEFRSCATPTLNQSAVLACMEPLNELSDGNNIAFPNNTLDDNSVLTYNAFGKFQGQEAISEFNQLYSLLGGRPENNENALFQNGCILSDTLAVRVQDATPEQCDIFVGAVQQSSVNPLVAADSNQFADVAFGYRLKYAPPSSSNDLLFQEQHLYVGNPLGLQDFAQDVFNSTKMASFVCETLQQQCGEDSFGFSGLPDCVESMSRLDTFKTNRRGEFRLSGNSTSCRMMHSFLLLDQLRDGMIDNDAVQSRCAALSLFGDAQQEQQQAGGAVTTPSCSDRDELDREFFSFSQSDVETVRRVAGGNDLLQSNDGSNSTDNAIIPPFARINTDLLPQDRFRSDNGGQQCATNLIQQVQRAMLQTPQMNLNGKDNALNMLCFTYLQVNEATADNIGWYWGVVVGMLIGFRLLSFVFLYHRATQTS